MQRLIIVSNRLPVLAARRKGGLTLTPSAGGLATGLGSYFEKTDSRWLGWPGLVPQNDGEKTRIKKKLLAENMLPVFLTEGQVEHFYRGFSNKTIWPIFHYFSQHAVYDKKFWDSYRQVNRLFCEEVLKVARKRDLIWVNDYQLMLLPGLIRKAIPEASIGFFLHIPFPSFELFRTLPWREEILEGMVGSDLVGFHTYAYVRHFISAATRILGLDSTLTRLTHRNRIIRIDSFPMGIDYRRYADAGQDPRVQREIARIRRIIGHKKIILSVDRLDYSKGIPQRLKVFNSFLEKHPEYREKVSLILVVVPSRSKVEHYIRLKEEVDELVGMINGRYSSIGWTPVWYLYRNLSFPMLSALYQVADIGLVTPVRDGMNLVAKEFVASRTDGRGVLILSEMAGAADELGDALTVNPNDLDDMEQALEKALTLPVEEQVRDNRKMQKTLMRYDVCRWAEDFLASLRQVKKLQKTAATRAIDFRMRRLIGQACAGARRRLFLLDYDGTLMHFSTDPNQVAPDRKLLDILRRLAAPESNEVVIISGRDRRTLEKWLGRLPVGLVAEHGVWIRESGRDWTMIEPLSRAWEDEIRPLLEMFAERTPGTFVETKDFSLVWHYRRADPDQGRIRSRELVNHLIYMTSNLGLQVLEGNKVVEVKNAGINKGRAARHWLEKQRWDFVLAVGDDSTDEDIFQVLPGESYSVRVGLGTTGAGLAVRSPEEVRNLLRYLLKGLTQ